MVKTDEFKSVLNKKGLYNSKDRKLLLQCLLCSPNGNILAPQRDMPGVGKNHYGSCPWLFQRLSLGLKRYGRIQFTPDALPIRYNRISSFNKAEKCSYNSGAIFTHWAVFGRWALTITSKPYSSGFAWGNGRKRAVTVDGLIISLKILFRNCNQITIGASGAHNF